MLEEEFDEDFLKLVREAFAIEANELVQAMKAGLKELEQAPEPARRTEVVVKIFRDAHSLKGSAGAVSRSDVASVGKALEDIFAQWKTSAVPVSPETFALLKRAMDLLGHLLQPSGTAIDPLDQMKVTRIVHELASVASAGN